VNNVISEFHGRRASDGGEIVAAVFAPEALPEGDWRCRVSCPALFSADKFIAGVDAAQARELAKVFFETLFSDLGVAGTWTEA